MANDYETLDVRPYQIMCIICRTGSEGGDPYYFEERLDEILEAARTNLIAPVRLRCYSDSDFAYQNPGREYDTPEGDLFNERRDLEILRLLGLAPGDARPAAELFDRYYRFIPACHGVCGYGEVTSSAWQGCRLADSGAYERGVAKGLAGTIPPRDPHEKARVKEESVRALYEADCLRIRPHHLLCITDFHGGRDDVAAEDEENLFEVIDICRKNPDMPIELVAGPCDVCPPCKSYRPEHNQCVKRQGAGLRDELRDLITLQILGMEYGAILPAREMFQRLYDRMETTIPPCAYGDGIERAPEWAVCGGGEGSAAYVRGRAVAIGIPGVEAPQDDP